MAIERKQRQGFGMFGKDDMTLLEGTLISAFFPEGNDLTIKDLMKRTDYSYERVNTSLKSLVEKKIVNEKKMGKTLVYSINFNNFYSEVSYKPYMLEREIDFIKRHKIKYDAIKAIIESNKFVIVILFGSYSKGTEREESDLDLICVPIGYSKKDKEEAERFIGSLRYNYNFKISPVVIPLHDFPNIKRDNKALWKDLVNFGIVFKGDDFFYYLAYKDDK